MRTEKKIQQGGGGACNPCRFFDKLQKTHALEQVF